MRGTRESRLASDLIDGETASSQEVPGDFEPKSRQILHQGNAQPLVRDVPEVVHRTTRGAGKVLSPKRLAIGLRHEVHHAEQRRSETRTAFGRPSSMVRCIHPSIDKQWSRCGVGIWMATWTSGGRCSYRSPAASISAASTRSVNTSPVERLMCSSLTSRTAAA